MAQEGHVKQHQHLLAVVLNMTVSSDDQIIFQQEWSRSPFESFRIITTVEAEM